MKNFNETDCRGDCLQWGGMGVDWAGDWLRPAKNARVFTLAPSVRLFEGASFYALQYVHFDGGIRYPVAGLVWSKQTGEIETVYTMPAFRGQGLARDLLAVGRACVGTIRHSQNLTPAGQEWVNKVG